METVTFYSYKGGVGRTLTLANIAAYLSNFGFKVCILDFDLEAPGVHYKFPTITYDVKKGLMDCIYDFYTEGIIPNSLDEYSIKEPMVSEEKGEIVVIPAGNVFSPSYWEKLGSVDWHKLFESDGILYFLELKQLIKETIKPDFLLIDSRTGVTEMSSLCTSILPDKVVFLVANNNENIEGARQIYRGIQNVERLDDQGQLEVVFALTRFPHLSSNKQELAKINELKNYLNEPVIKDVDNKLTVNDITVLHSDRELEIKETLRINDEYDEKEPVLRRDYLKLFSKIIPEGLIQGRLGNIINDITNSNLLFTDPDKAQSNLENLVATYPHPLSLEKLIEFYILRNEDYKKVLEAFSDYWNTFGDENKDLIIKYTRFFMNYKDRYYYGVKFELDKIEKYISYYPEDLVVRLKLAQWYSSYNKHLDAIRHYEYLLERMPENDEIIGNLLNQYLRVIENADVDKIKDFILNYEEIIDSDVNRLITKIQIYDKIGLTEEFSELLVDDLSIQDTLLHKDLQLYIKLMSKHLGDSYVIKNLPKVIEESARYDDVSTLTKVLAYYTKLGISSEFYKILDNYSPPVRLIRELERRSERF